MRRLPVISFAALVVATVAAFFITQHLKVSTPLINGFPAPFPAAIDPLDGVTCYQPATHRYVNHRRMTISFYLQNRAGDVAVRIVDQGGVVVATLASDRYMAIKRRVVFTWNGREDTGQLAPDGKYYVTVELLQEDRTVTISNSAGPEPVTVETHVPRPVVTGVSPHLISPDPTASVTVHFSGNEHLAATVELYRSDVRGEPRLVKHFLTSGNSQTTIWDGSINKRPAPAGTYLVGLEVTDPACNTERFPKVLPPPPGSTAHDGVTVDYLSAAPPLEPVAAGSTATVSVYSSRGGYSWSLTRVGAHRAAASGGGRAAGASRTSTLRVPLPPDRAGLYRLALQAGPFRTTVPLVAHAGRPARVLVVLPALTWQGLNPFDGDGDGLPDTLASGQPVALVRPLIDGLPPGFAGEQGLLSYLDASHRAYDVTTDLGLFSGEGPALAGHRLVILAGAEQWLPELDVVALRRYVEHGGHVLAVGVGPLRTVTIARGSALDPSKPSSADALDARPGALVAGNTQPIAVIEDGLGIFAGALGGFDAYRPIPSVAPPAQIVSEAGVSQAAPSVIGYRLGKGAVVEIGLAGFGARLAHDAAARKLVNRLWTVLAG